MADLRVRCKGCRSQFRPRKGTRRLFCETCRPSRAGVGLASVPPVPTSVDLPPGEVERTVREVLEQAGRLATVPGVLAVRLAKQLDAATGAATTAALAKQIDELTAKAMLGAKPAPDFVDDMAARRAAREGA